MPKTLTNSIPLNPPHPFFPNFFIYDLISKPKPPTQNKQPKPYQPPHTSMGEKMSACACGFLFSLFLLLFFTLNEARFNHANELAAVNGTAVAAEMEMMPLMEPGKAEMMVEMNETRRRLGSFQICALCTCCGGAKGYCLPSPCCYAINCNIPNRPFGFCSFTPKTCNCFGCHL